MVILSRADGTWPDLSTQEVDSTKVRWQNRPTSLDAGIEMWTKSETSGPPSQLPDVKCRGKEEGGKKNEMRSAHFQKNQILLWFFFLNEVDYIGCGVLVGIYSRERRSVEHLPPSCYLAWLRSGLLLSVRLYENGQLQWYVTHIARHITYRAPYSAFAVPQSIHVEATSAFSWICSWKRRVLATLRKLNSSTYNGCFSFAQMPVSPSRACCLSPTVRQFYHM
jgi:hypothetical protein